MSQLSRFKNTGDLLLPVRLKQFLEIYLIGSPTSLFYISIWSVLHFVSGCAVGAFFAYAVAGRSYTFFSAFWIAFVIHLVWEIWQLLITNTPKTLRGLIDFLVDTALFLLGFMVVHYAAE